MAIPGDALHKLQQVAFDFRRLCKAAATGLVTRGDVQGFDRRMRAAGRLIASLPELIEDLLDDTPESASVMDAIRAMADEADRYLLASDYHAIGMMLEPHGSRELDRNHLERLIDAHNIE